MAYDIRDLLMEYDFELHYSERGADSESHYVGAEQAVRILREIHKRGVMDEFMEKVRLLENDQD